MYAEALSIVVILLALVTEHVLAEAGVGASTALTSIAETSKERQAVLVKFTLLSVVTLRL